MSLLIRLARREDLDAVWLRVRSAVAFMNAHGNPQWNEAYPRPEHFSAALEAGSLFVAEVDGTVAGAVVLDTHQPPQYAALPWTTPERSLVIHKLALGQEYMGCGVAAAIFAFAEEEAARRGLGALRVDTYYKNHFMRRRLARQGFAYVGAVRFPAQQAGEYLCFEKRISPENV